MCRHTHTPAICNVTQLLCVYSSPPDLEAQSMMKDDDYISHQAFGREKGLCQYSLDDGLIITESRYWQVNKNKTRKKKKKKKRKVQIVPVIRSNVWMADYDDG